MKYLIVTLSIIVLSWLSNNVSAAEDDLTVKIHLASYHQENRGRIVRGTNKTMNERNLGIGLQKGDYQIGFYHNTFYRYSGYISYTKPIVDNVSISLGLVTGYRFSHGKDVLPTFTIGFKVLENVEVNLVNGQAIALSLVFN